MTPDEQLYDAVLSNALDLLRLSARQRATMVRRLQELAKSLAAQLGSADLTNKREVETVIAQSEKLIEEYYGGLQGQLAFESMAEAVSHQTSQALIIALGNQAVNLPLNDYFNSLASEVLIQGSPIKDWFDAQSEAFKFKYKAAVRQGLANAETNQQIISRLVGKPRLGISGVLDIARRDAASLVNTSVQAVANDARLATFKANSDVLTALKQISTLDGHTTLICIAYSGATWELDGTPLKGSPAFNGGPPRHFNCRSVIVPITKTFAQLGINLPEPKPTTRASDLGPIAAKTSFDDFLKRKGQAFQDEILGVGRAELWREGKITLRDLVSGDGNPLSLAALRRKAGLR
jgi:hypothetical protein